jgi:hypothetical protein
MPRSACAHRRSRQRSAQRPSSWLIEELPRILPPSTVSGQLLELRRAIRPRRQRTRAAVGLLVALPFIVVIGCRHAAKPTPPVSTALAARPAPPVSTPSPSRPRITDDSVENQSAHLADGLEVHWHSSFPKNELTDSVRVQGGFLALTASGNLVRVDEQLRLVRVGRFFPPLTALAHVDGVVWAGAGDGGILAIDADDLSAREIARVRGVPQWIGARSDGGKALKPVVVAERSEDGHPAGQIVLDVARDREWPIRAHGASAFFLDDKSRLWLGGDHGEWGGTLGWCDLATGAMHPLADLPLEGVYGIGVVKGGPVLTWGGMLHMGLGKATVGQAEPRKSLYQQERGGRDPPRVLDRPALPITQLVDESGDGKSIAVFAFDGVFRADPSFQSWTKLGKLEVRYAPGRPDAVGAYPALRAVHVLGPGHFLLATGLDGYVEFDRGRCIPHALSDDVPVRNVRSIRNTADGLLFVGDEEAPSFWYRDGRWRAATLDPPFHDVCPDPHDLCGDAWSDWRGVLVAPDGTLFTANQANIMPGPLPLTRWRAGRPEIIARESENGVPSVPGAVFLTPDGTFWYAWDVLARLVNGRWRVVSKLVNQNERLPWVPQGLRAVNAAGPPWILVSDSFGGIVRLSYERGFANARIESIAGDEAGDALALDEKRIVVAGREGLKLYATDPGTLSKWTGPVPEGKVFHLARDRRGRIWMGGEGLWLLEADEKRIHSLASLNITSGRITALAADPARDDGVVFVTRANEVAFVQAGGEVRAK